MSWLFKSLKSDDPQDFSSSSPSPDSPNNRGGGVKEDLSLIGESIGRQLRRVASFLAPPSTTDDRSQFSDSLSSPSQSQALLGVRNDLVEIGGSLKTGLSLLSCNRAVTEISKLTSSLLQFQSSDDQGRNVDDNVGYDYDNEYTPGIADEVINFVKEISLRPECWTDFPLSLETDFKMSDVQKEHASTVEHMVPSLTDLRENLDSYMGHEQFWLIYFILVLPRMNEEDIEVLSCPEIVETRSRLLEKLQETRNINKEKEVTERLQIDNAEEMDPKKLENDDDVSFSDLEDDENDRSSRNSGCNQVQRTPSLNGTSDWVQLNEMQASVQRARREKDWDAESSDWLKVDDSD